MVGRLENFIGNVLFYDYLLSKRTPTFLNRNLNRAFQLHQEDQERGCPAQVSEVGLPSQPTAWRMPSEQSLNNMIEDEKDKQAFTVHVKGIDSLKSNNKYWSRPAKKKGPLFRFDVDVYITIFDPVTKNACQKVTHPKVRMLGVHSDRGHEVSFDMPATVIRLDDLLQSRGSGEGQTWGKTAPKVWEMMVSINFQGSKDTIEFWSHLKGADPALQKDPSSRLVMRWPNIWNCPAGGESVQPLTVGWGQGIDLGLKISMFWQRPKDESILARHNRQLRSPQKASQYPTPPPVEPSTPSRKAYELKFVYLNETLTRQGLVCPHDPCSRRNFNDVDDLCMHLQHWHELFKYRYTKEREANGIQYWQFVCDIADHKADQQRASNAAPDPREIQVVAPKKPFQRRKYLDEDDESFQKAARLERVAKPVAVNGAATAIRAKNPNEVQDRVQAERKTFRVPKAPPDITFFRAISKRPLQEGEYISESDDEVEMNWVQLKKDAQIETNTTIPEATRRFLRIFDTFMKEERLQDEVHVGDALIRFARAKSALLWQHQIVDEFRLKLDELIKDKVVTKEVHTACLDIVNNNNNNNNNNEPSRQPSDSFSDQLASLQTRPRRLPLSPAHDRLNGPQKSPAKKVNKGKGKAKVTEMGHITPQTADSDGDVEMRDADNMSHLMNEVSLEASPFDECLCGEDALVSRGRAVVVCNSTDCIRHAFHVDCVIRHWKPPQPPDPKKNDWICNDCKTAQ